MSQSNDGYVDSETDTDGEYVLPKGRFRTVKGERLVVGDPQSSSDDDVDVPSTDVDVTVAAYPLRLPPLPGRAGDGDGEALSSKRVLGKSGLGTTFKAAALAARWGAKKGASEGKYTAEANKGEAKQGEASQQDADDATTSDLPKFLRPQPKRMSTRRVIPELDVANEEDREYMACRRLVMLVVSVTMLTFVVVLSSILSNAEAFVSKTSCSDSEGEDVDCTPGCGVLSICRGEGGNEERVECSSNIDWVLLLFVPVFCLVVNGGILLFLLGTSCLLKLNRLEKRFWIACVKILSMVASAAGLAAVLAMVLIYFIAVQYIQPYQWISPVKDMADPSFGWTLSASYPRILDAVRSTSSNSQAEDVLGSCNANEWGLLLDFTDPPLQGSTAEDRVLAELCWVEASSGLFRTGSSLTECAAIGNRTAWCCARLLPYGDVAYKFRTTLVTVRETYLAMMIVSIFLELIGIAFTYALIVWDY